jgi:hypothetical protein
MSNLANILRGTSMRFFASIYIFAFAVLLFATPSHAQSIELFGGYSFVRAPVSFTQPILCPAASCPNGTNTQHLNFNGWEAAHSKSWDRLPSLQTSVELPIRSRALTYTFRRISLARSFAFLDACLRLRISWSVPPTNRSTRARARSHSGRRRAPSPPHLAAGSISKFFPFSPSAPFKSIIC